eukprot:15472553-Alexandrium_andersonii.AAC.1
MGARRRLGRAQRTSALSLPRVPVLVRLPQAVAGGYHPTGARAALCSKSRPPISSLGPLRRGSNCHPQRRH